MSAVRAVVTDIEGTTSSIAFVKEVLFPFARRRLPAFVASRRGDPEVRRLLDEARALAGEAAPGDDGTAALLQRWIDEDRKATPLKALQGLLWAEGYTRGELTGHVHADAAAALRAWHARGLRLYIYSSGSIAAQKLLFGHTAHGDLTPLFSGYFDTTTGPKVEPRSYALIIDALKRSGVTDVLSLSAVGSLREDLPPGTFVVVDQFIDRTFARQKSFFSTGVVAHVSMAKPVCPRLGDAVMAACEGLDVSVRRGGKYLVMEGPQFSSFAESELYRSWGCDVIGMTNMPEAKLAREAELCYATVAMVTDFDCWHPDHDAVSVDQVVSVLLRNADRARALVRNVVPLLGSDQGPCRHGCQTALDSAIITAAEARDPALVERLSAVAGRVLR